MNWFLMGLKRYTDFSGRSRRSEYWYFFLIYLIIVFALVFLENGFSFTPGKSAVAGVLSSIFMLAMLIPSLALSIRRLHDIGKSGWWLLLCLIPVVGFALIYFACLDGEAESNRFGANPKAVT
jgi:uncharacterized membrane protein YhaH (DUF805 family)